MRTLVTLLSVIALLTLSSAAFAQHPKTVKGTSVYYLYPSSHSD